MFDPSAFSRRHPDPAAAERAFRKPSTTVWLGSIALCTDCFDEAIAFYVGTLGFHLRSMAPHTADSTFMQAFLVDADGQDVLELIEVPPMPLGARSVTQLGFRLPQRTWQLLRVRLLAQEYPFTEVGDAVFLEDPNGVMLKMESMG
ncbi:MAG: VOC family protein [Bacteroidota bacterium]